MRSTILDITLSLALGLIGIATDEPPGGVDKDQSAGTVEKDELVLNAEIDPDFGYVFHVKDKPALHLPISCQLHGKKRELANPDIRIFSTIYNHTLRRGRRLDPVGGRVEQFTKEGTFNSNVELVAPGGSAHGPPPVSYDGHFVSIEVEIVYMGKNGNGQTIDRATFKGILVYPKPMK
jgi:hypothetical protein